MDQKLVLIRACLGFDLTSWVYEVARTVELANIPGGLGSHPVNCRNENTIGGRSSRLL